MKKIFIFVLLGLFLVSANVVINKVVSTPATPKIVLVKSFIVQSDATDVFAYVSARVREGFIVKSIAGANDGQTYSTWVVVLEKY